MANTRIYVLLLALFVLVIVFVAYRYYALQRLRLANLRIKISQDLHDEVGATLSGIGMYSYIAKEKIKQGEQTEVENSLNVIKENATEMVAKLNDIVWTVNPLQDHLVDLIERLREFAIQITNAKQIQLHFNKIGKLDELKLPMQSRKNIYLICKEAINNAVKYSEAEVLEVVFEIKHKMLVVAITDNGKGFLVEEETKGNGLLNMKNRAREIDLKLAISSELHRGTSVHFTYKF